MLLEVVFPDLVQPLQGWHEPPARRAERGSEQDADKLGAGEQGLNAIGSGACVGSS